MFNVHWNSKERDAVGVSASVISLVGLWTVDEDIYFIIRRLISTFSVASIVIQSSYESYLNCVRLENNADNLYSINFGLTALSKVLFFFIHRRKLRIIVSSIVKDWSSVDANNYSYIMYNCKSNCQKFAQYFLSFGFFTTVMYNIKVYFIDPDVIIVVENDKNIYDGNKTMMLGKRFLLPAACGFSDASQVIYWTISVVQWFTFSVTFGINFFSDVFFTAIATHICAQFQILKVKFASISELTNVTGVRKKFNVLVVRHVHLLDLAMNLETIFTMIIFIQMVVNVVIWNIAGFNVLVLVKKREVLSALTNTSLLLFSLVQTFMYSYVGEMLTCKSDGIADSVYQSEWYSMPQDFSKNFIFVIARTRLPIGLTAGKFFKMTRFTFTRIVNTAVSYLSVLRIMIEDNI